MHWQYRSPLLALFVGAAIPIASGCSSAPTNDPSAKPAVVVPSERVEASAKAHALGIATFVVARDKDTRTITALDADGSTAGTLHVVEHGKSQIVQWQGSIGISLHLDGNAHTLEIATDRGDHEKLSLADKQKSALADRYADEVAKLGLVLDETSQKVAGAGPARSLPTSVNGFDIGGGVIESLICGFGSVRGFSMGVSKSSACDGATQDANNQCSDGFMDHCGVYQVTGSCCRTLSCDCYCALGDYGCECGVTGYKYQDDPTSSCGGGSGSCSEQWAPCFSSNDCCGDLHCNGYYCGS